MVHSGARNMLNRPNGTQFYVFLKKKPNSDFREIVFLQAKPLRLKGYSNERFGKEKTGILLSPGPE